MKTTYLAKKKERFAEQAYIHCYTKPRNQPVKSTPVTKKAGDEVAKANHHPESNSKELRKAGDVS